MLEKIIPLVQEAGKIVLSAQDIGARTHEKTSASDLVTDYDVAVEQFLKEKLPPLVSGSVFCGEEELEYVDPSQGWAFIVDPIDGTTNFVRSQGHSAVSVALAHDGQVEYAVVWNPYREELFTAARGCGAFLNGKPIHVTRRPLHMGVFGMGTAIYRREYIAPTMKVTEQLLRRSCDFRRLGAASLDICWVACGRTDAFFEFSLSPWDYAAASLILTEAGGALCTMDGEALPMNRRCSVWAANQVNFDIRKELEF